MPTREAYNKTKLVQLLALQTVTADTWSLALDLSTIRADAVSIIVAVGDMGSTSGSNHIDLELWEAADGETITDASAYTIVAAAGIEGTELPVDVDAAAKESLTYRAGYKGTKRYLAAKLDVTGTISGPVGVWAELSYLHEAPGSNITITTGQPA